MTRISYWVIPVGIMCPLAKAQFTGELHLPLGSSIESLNTGAWTIGHLIFTQDSNSTLNIYTSGALVADSLTINIAGKGLNSGGLAQFSHTFTESGRFMFDASATLSLEGPGTTYIAWRKNSESVTLIVSAESVHDAAFDVVTGDQFYWYATTQGGVLFPDVVYKNAIEVTFSNIRFASAIPEPGALSAMVGCLSIGLACLNRRRLR